MKTLEPTSPLGYRREGSTGASSGRWWLTLAVIGVLLIAGAYWAGTKVVTPGALRAQTAPPPSTVLTAPVVLRRLSEQLSVTGVVTAAHTIRVNFGSVNVPNAQPIVTRRPPSRGSVVLEGSQLAEVAGRPIFALLGITPMYRDLAVGDRGSDVTQLQNDLAALGFGITDSSGVLGRGTASAIRAFYGDAGYPPPAPASAARKPGTIVLPQAEVVFVPRLPAVVRSCSLALGQPIRNPVFVLASGSPRVVVHLNGAQASLVKRGDTAMLHVSGTNGATAAAVVIKVRGSARADASSTAILRMHRSLSARMIGNRVNATITIAGTKGAVLAVPLAALYTTAAGVNLVTVIAGRRRVDIPVKLGPAIGGYVPVRPTRGRLVAGERVLVGE